MYYFIVNPNSRSGRGLEIWNQLKDTLINHNISYEIFLTEHVGHAAEIAKTLSCSSHPDQGEKTIIGLGGDGTLNEIVNGLRFSPLIRLGFIPCGSGNDFCRGLRLSRDPEKALLSLLVSDRIRPIDYGILTCIEEGVPKTRRFAVSCGCGYDAAVCESILKSPVKKLMNRLHMGKLTYLLVGIKEILKSRETDGILTLDHEKRIPVKGLRFLSFHNVPFEGGGFRFAPSAKYDDGQLTLCMVSDCSKLRMTGILVLSLLGKHTGIRGVKVYNCRNASLQLEDPYPIHTDGEILGSYCEIIVQCESRKISFLC